MKITRYVNGEKVRQPLQEIIIKSDIIKDTIAKVNSRINTDDKKVVNE